jgi:hypothetical protein
MINTVVDYDPLNKIHKSTFKQNIDIYVHTHIYVHYITQEKGNLFLTEKYQLTNKNRMIKVYKITSFKI